ncbi:MAG TPA: hypothetical protein VMW43_06055 [Bacteroidota bacterium]|nr:hypothetical protein [Bacteroidota bacterium]
MTTSHHRFAGILFTGILLVVILAGCETDAKRALHMSKSTFEKICRNDQSAADNIDWSVLLVNGEEVGRGFVQLTSDFEKSEYRAALISRLNNEFGGRKWNVMTVKNWRIESQGVESVIIAADAPNGGLISMTFQKNGLEKKISKIDYH